MPNQPNFEIPKSNNETATSKILDFTETEMQEKTTNETNVKSTENTDQTQIQQNVKVQKQKSTSKVEKHVSYQSVSQFVGMNSKNESTINEPQISQPRPSKRFDVCLFGFVFVSFCCFFFVSFWFLLLTIQN
jgi:hypothetical protein